MLSTLVKVIKLLKTKQILFQIILHIEILKPKCFLPPDVRMRRFEVFLPRLELVPILFWEHG